MATFGRRSRKRLATVDSELVAVLDEAIRHTDFSVIWGHRDMEAQNRAFADGNSKKRWPTSKHNAYPSHAVDIVPYPNGYDATIEEFYEMATYVYQAASALGIRIRWGGHWKNYTGKGELDRDWSHIELVIN